MQKKLRPGKSMNQEIDEAGSFVYSVMFIKLVFRPNNNVCIGILSYLIAEITGLAIFKW